MKERIKKLRKELDLTQQGFADRLGIKQNTVATYEIGKIEPGNSTIALICREFSVNEKWLRTGEGAMFKELTGDDEVAMYVSTLLEDSDNPFQSLIIDIVRTYCELDSKSQAAVDLVVKDLVANIKKGRED